MSIELENYIERIYINYTKYTVREEKRNIQKKMISNLDNTMRRPKCI